MQRVIGYTLLPNGLYRALYEELGANPRDWLVSNNPIHFGDSTIIAEPSNYVGKPTAKYGPRINMTGTDKYPEHI